MSQHTPGVWGCFKIFLCALWCTAQGWLVSRQKNMRGLSLSPDECENQMGKKQKLGGYIWSPDQDTKARACSSSEEQDFREAVRVSGSVGTRPEWPHSQLAHFPGHCRERGRLHQKGPVDSVLRDSGTWEGGQLTAGLGVLYTWQEG